MSYNAEFPLLSAVLLYGLQFFQYCIALVTASVDYRIDIANDTDNTHKSWMDLHFDPSYSPILFFGVRVRSLLRFLGLNYRNNSVLLMILTTQPKVSFGFPLRSLLLSSSIFLVRVLRFLGLYYRNNSYRLKVPIAAHKQSYRCISEIQLCCHEEYLKNGS